MVGPIPDLIPVPPGFRRHWAGFRVTNTSELVRRLNQVEKDPDCYFYQVVTLAPSHQLVLYYQLVPDAAHAALEEGDTEMAISLEEGRGDEDGTGSESGARGLAGVEASGRGADDSPGDDGPVVV